MSVVAPSLPERTGTPTSPAGAGSARPPRARRPPADAELAASVALTLLTLATLVAMRRLFTDWSYLGPAAAAAISVHALSWLARRRRLPAAVAVVIPVLVLLCTVGWDLLPETTFYGIPTQTTIDVGIDRLQTSLTDFRTLVAPAPVTAGFIVACVLGAVLVAMLSDWAAFRMRAPVEAVIPAFGLFIFAAALGDPAGRLASLALELAAIFTFVLVYQVSQHRHISGWVADRSAGSTVALLKAGGGIGLVALVAALLVGPNLPGAGSKALVTWKNHSNDSPSSRSTVSPFVDIRGRLVDRAQTEVFTVSSASRAYWRLTSLDTFDGNIWSSNDSYKSVKTNLGGDPVDDGGHEVVATFQIGSLDSIWLPAAYEPQAITGIRGVSYNAESGSLISSKATTDGLSYTVTSEVPNLTAAQLQASTAVDASTMSRYLRLPRISRQVTNLANQIVRGQTTEYGRAKALQDYLRSHYTYDTNVQLTHSQQAINEFLFVKKRGYCEQFAGSYAVLARQVGLPTRIAVGFTSGSLGPDGLLHVKDEHAHAWPEVYFADAGWVAFEPTPGRAVPGAQAYTNIPDSAGPGGGSAATATPAGVTTTTAPGGTPSTTTPDDATLAEGSTSGQHRSPWTMAAIVLAALAVLAAVWALAVPALLRSRRTRAWRSATVPADRVLLAWQSANVVLSHAGVGRRPYETFNEHARRAVPGARLVGEAESALFDLAGDAATANYADEHLADEDAERAASAATAVEQAIMAGTSRRQRVLWAMDPRPLVSSGRR